MAIDGVEAAVHEIELLADDWNARVQAIRRIPAAFGQRQHTVVYQAVAEGLYRPFLSPQFAYVKWRADYELEPFEAAYDVVMELTTGFAKVTPADIAGVLHAAPQTLKVFRAIVGYTPNELAVATSELGFATVSQNRVKSMEAGKPGTGPLVDALAEAIDRLMSGTLWEVASEDVRTKMDKPDTSGGWSTVRQFVNHGVPYALLLHQRHYGGAFRTLLDATSTARGDMLEEPLEELLVEKGVPHLRTGAHNQRQIAAQFGLTVQPAPDFVIFEPPSSLRAIIECKHANDGGTARDKAARFGTLSSEGARLGGVPVFAVLDGLGWERTSDALGPVVRHTDGRIFTLQTLPEILQVEPFPNLIGITSRR
ncbi:MAG: hypothetical protein WEE66_14865 [Actinomycetota bacterium]